jgi:hypothetical protein
MNERPSTSTSANTSSVAVGLFADDLVPKSALPALMGTVVGADAFSQVLTNPLLSANVFSADMFSGAGMKAINDTGTLADIARRNVRDENIDPLVTFTRQRSSRRARTAAATQAAEMQTPRVAEEVLIEVGDARNGRPGRETARRLS